MGNARKQQFRSDGHPVFDFGDFGPVEECLGDIFRQPGDIDPFGLVVAFLIEVPRQGVDQIDQVVDFARIRPDEFGPLPHDSVRRAVVQNLLARAVDERERKRQVGRQVGEGVDPRFVKYVVVLALIDCVFALFADLVADAQVADQQQRTACKGREVDCDGPPRGVDGGRMRIFSVLTGLSSLVVSLR